MNFTNLSNIIPGKNTVWNWDFGDGTVSNEISPQHTYLAPGVYSVKLIAMDSDGHSDSLLLENIIRVIKGTKVVSGSVEGEWEKDYSPYYIFGNVQVPPGKKLTIEAGVEVVFIGSYSLDIFGSLFALGNVSDTIEFRANDTTNMGLYKGMKISYPDGDFQYSRGWTGIHFISDQARQDSCVMKYVKVQDVRYGNPNFGPNDYKGTLKLHRMYYSEIRNSFFSNNFTTPQNFITVGDTSARNYQTAGIHSVGSNPIITDCKFENQYQSGMSGVYVGYSDSTQIARNLFFNIYGSAVKVEGVTHFDIAKNRFDSVLDAGLIISEISEPTSLRTRFNQVRENYFTNSGKGISAGGVSKVDIYNNAFIGNVGEIDVCLTIWGDSIYVINNLFYKNSVTFTTSNIGATCIGFHLADTKVGVIANNTLIENRGFGRCQAIIYGDEDVVIANNIVRNISGTELQGERFTTGYQFTDFKKTMNNNVKGGYQSGTTNFDAPPGFVDSLNGNFRLALTSGSVNKGGSATSDLHLPLKDFYGNLRIDTFSRKVDIGCAEFMPAKPIEITLSSDSIKEKLPKGSVVGTLSTKDHSSLYTHRYSLLNLPGTANDNSSFTLSNNTLYTADVFDSSDSLKLVTIRSTNNLESYIDSTFKIFIKRNFDSSNSDDSTGIIADTTSNRDTSNFLKETFLYPNPVYQNLNIKVSEAKKGSWKIYDLQGRFVRSGTYNGDGSINLSDLKKGIYLFHILEGDKGHVYKILKE